MDKYRGDRLGLVLAFWGFGIVLGRPLVSQTDYTEDGKTFGETHASCLCALNISRCQLAQAIAAASTKNIPLERAQAWGGQEHLIL